jgi:outer membrane lipoprotein-sorting protein
VTEAHGLRLVALITALSAMVAAPPVFAATDSTAPAPATAVPSVKTPFPRLRPTAAVPTVPATKPATAPQPKPATAPAAVTLPPPALPPGFAVNPRSKFTADQQMALARITTYFNSFRTMEGRFVQIGPSGEQSEGAFNLSRPGNIRFHYNPPSRLDVIADGRSVAIRDGAAGTQDIYPLSKTPLRYLLADQVDLTSDRLVDSVREDPDLISILIIEQLPFVSGKLVLIFDRKTYALRQWIVTDAQGLNTSVAIYNVTTDRAQDPKQFVISSAF